MAEQMAAHAKAFMQAPAAEAPHAVHSPTPAETPPAFVPNGLAPDEMVGKQPDGTHEAPVTEAPVVSAAAVEANVLFDAQGADEIAEWRSCDSNIALMRCGMQTGIRCPCRAKCVAWWP